MTKSRPGRRQAVAPNARSIAAHVVARVLKDAAYAAAALDAELAQFADLDSREAALATELVYGTLRTWPVLIERIERHAKKGLRPKDHFVRAQLAVAAYQILVLDRVPAHAAIDAAVGSIRARRGRRVAGFGNAVLRRLADGGEELDRIAAVFQSVPAWLRADIERAVGEPAAKALLSAGGDRGAEAVTIRLRETVDPPAWLNDADSGRVSALARKVRRGGDLRKRQGWDEGAFVVQEEGAQVIAMALGARPGERVLDACAGRGQKTSLLADRVGPDGAVWAADASPTKLEALKREFERLRLGGVSTAAVDWTTGVGDVPDGFDRVLVDAPCTGVGSLRRRPEIAIRIERAGPKRLADVAVSILLSAATRARPGGRVVFAVCSILEVECEGVVSRVGDALEPAAFDARCVLPIAGSDATSFRLLPGEHGTDGYFVASFVRR